jgi:hypothetical protein
MPSTLSTLVFLEKIMQEKNYNINVSYKSFERVEQCKYLEITLTN